jgi:hypothetical protein
MIQTKSLKPFLSSHDVRKHGMWVYLSLPLESGSRLVIKL